MSNRKMFIVMLVLAVTVGSAGLAAARQGGGGSHAGNSNFSQGRGSMNRSMAGKSADNMGSHNMNQNRNMNQDRSMNQDRNMNQDMNHVPDGAGTDYESATPNVTPPVPENTNEQ